MVYIYNNNNNNNTSNNNKIKTAVYSRYNTDGKRAVKTAVALAVNRAVSLPLA